MMRLETTVVPGWPKLAWVARLPQGADTVEVLHGPMVETRDDWAVEAVWAGPFEHGDFDRTPLVFGSGVRCRQEGVIFVTAGTGVDRLWYCRYAGAWWVANSLPALLACAGLSLREHYRQYTSDIETVERDGIRHYRKSLPADPVNVRLVYFDNLLYDGRELAEAPKTGHIPPLRTYRAYYDFLVRTAKRLRRNSTAPGRRHHIVPLVGLSTGYDSPAVAAVAKHAGCTLAATIKQSRSLWRGSDSGAAIARHLGLSCRCYDRARRTYPHEEAIWAATGLAGGMNLITFEYPEPLCLFFSGSYGDKVWDRFHHDLSEPVGDRDHLLGEFRLIQGVFQCVVPWWGIRRAQEINAIGASDEMAPWSLQTGYDRPVARRLAEEAGVPRHLFGMLKRDTSANVEFPWPFSPKAQEDYRRFLRARGFWTPSRRTARLIGKVAHVENLLWQNLLRKLKIRRRLRPWRRLAATRLLFHWGNDRLRRVYASGLAGLARNSGGHRCA